MKAWRIGLSACLLLSAATALAQDEELMPPVPDGEAVAIFDRASAASDACTACGPGCTHGTYSANTACGPFAAWSVGGWFVGLGGSYNSVKVDQTFNGVGNTDVYESGILVATGTATGPAPPFRETATTFAPVAHFGFIRPLHDGWSWGSKLSYKYLGLTFSDNNVDAPQTGSFTSTGVPPTVTDFTGNAFSLSLQTSVNNELSLITFVTREFSRGRVYLGGGPVVFDVQNRMYDLFSYADINGVTTNIGGAPLDLANESWLWGGIGQLGLMYHLRPNCFFDISYDFAVTGTYNDTWPQSVTSQSGSETYISQIEYLLEQQIWAQSLNFTFNWLF